MRKKILSFGIFLTLVGTISGTAAPVTQLDEVVVTANRIEEKGTMPGGFVRQNTNLGLSGEKDIMDVPYTAQSLSQKSIAVMVMPPARSIKRLPTCPPFAPAPLLSRQTSLSAGSAPTAPLYT